MSNQFEPTPLLGSESIENENNSSLSELFSDDLVNTDQAPSIEDVISKPSKVSNNVEESDEVRVNLLNELFGDQTVIQNPVEAKVKKEKTIDLSSNAEKFTKKISSQPVMDPKLSLGEHKDNSNTNIVGKINYNSLEKRYSDSARLWPIVDEVMLIAGSNNKIQGLVSALELTRDKVKDDEQREELFRVIKPILATNGLKISDPTDIPPILQMAYDELIGISVLGDLWRDDSVSEILVDGWDKISVEIAGKLSRTNISFRDALHANSVARSLALRVSERQVSRSINLVTSELPRARVQFAYGPVVKGGLAIAIRKFSALLDLNKLKSLNALNEEMEQFLKDCVHSRAGILVSGGTGTGKTTIINLLSSFIPSTERIVTIEDAFELSLTGTHIVSLQTKEASSADDTVSVSLSQLLKATLRLRPDRIIVGEIREGEGAEVMLAAANTGHDGTMTTIHANTPDMAVNERLVDLIRQNRNSSDDAIRRTIASAFELVVQVERGRKGNRFISGIMQVDRDFINSEGILALRPIFTGADNGDGTTLFKKENKVQKNTVLEHKLEDYDILTWLED